MRIIIGKCNNTDCARNQDDICCLPSSAVHEFQYDHINKTVDCQHFIDLCAELPEQSNKLLAQKRCIHDACRVYVFASSTVCWNCNGKQ